MKKQPEIRSVRAAKETPSVRAHRERREHFYKGCEFWVTKPGEVSRKWREAGNEDNIGTLRVFCTEAGKWVSRVQAKNLLMVPECPHCGFRLVDGPEHRTTSQQIARLRGYPGHERKEKIYLDARYATLDHIKPKSLYPELMFYLSNLQVICWQCNSSKGDDCYYLERQAIRKQTEAAKDRLMEI